MFWLIKIYRILSPMLAAMGAQCRFYPSCSVYLEEAWRKYGGLKAWRMGFWRLLRCHPFCEGGIDHP